jgi:hypothetical protein
MLLQEGSGILRCLVVAHAWRNTDCSVGNQFVEKLAPYTPQDATAATGQL